MSKTKPCSSVLMSNRKIHKDMSRSVDWSKLLKVLIAVLTAVAGSLGIVSCMS